MKKTFLFLFFFNFWAASFAQDDKEQFFGECMKEAYRLFTENKRQEALIALQNCEKGTKDPKMLYELYRSQSDLYSDLSILVKKSYYLPPNNNYYQAVRLLEKAIQLDSVRFEAYEDMSLLHHHYQEFKKALVYINVALHRSQFIRGQEKRIKVLLELINIRATVRTALNDSEGATSDLLEIIRIDSLNLDGYCNLGVEYSRIGEHQKAIAILLKAYQINNKDESILGNLGFVYQQAGHYEESIRYYDEFEQLLKTKKQGYDGALGLFYNNRGFSKFKLGKVQEGLEDINRSLKFYPENSWAYKNRALVYLELGEKEKACADLQQAKDYGYSQQYGEEVQNLLKKHCQKGKK